MPLPVITISQMRDWERATWAMGQSEAEVIRRVGLAVGELALGLTQPGDQVVILAGRGHNGEDARLTGAHLPGRQINLLDVVNPRSDLERVRALLASRPALVIDGLFGIGLNRPLDPDWVDLLRCVNESSSRVLSIDVPSGLNADTGQPMGAAIAADITLSVGAPKVGLFQQTAWAFVGRLAVAESVGLAPWSLPTELGWTTASDFAGFPPPRSPATHKGSYGHLGIIAGSAGFHGAAALASRSAQRAQPGLITLLIPEQAYPAAAAQLQAVMVKRWDQQEALPAGWDAILVGPGLAGPDITEATRSLVQRLWHQSPHPIVADASALDWLPTGAVTTDALRVITPHPGEAARMLGASTEQIQSDRPSALRELSQRFGKSWVVLKGHQTLVGGPACHSLINPSGNPYLAQGGSGDALAGYIAGLLAQPGLRQDPLRTLRYAVWHHGAVADQLQASRPGWVVEELAAKL